MRFIKVITFLVMTVVLLVSSAQAAIIATYTNKADFLAATGAESVTGTLPNLGGLGNGNSVVLGGVTLNLVPGSSTQFFVDERTVINPGFDIAISGDEDFDAVLDVPTFSFGFDVVEPDGLCIPMIICIDTSTFTITVGLENETFQLMGTLLASPEFIGIVSDELFSFIEVRETITSPNASLINNDFFGEFYADAPVPIPASIWLFGSALGLLAWNKRKA